jgi:predicted RNase H-like HicB family nuclease
MATMKLTYRVLLHPDEGGYAVVVPALPGCFSQGNSIEEAIEHAMEAIEVHIAGLRRSGEPVPEGDTTPDQSIDVPITITVAA